MESTILCRDDEDYDAMVKYIFVCARRKKVRVIDYIVMSNHAHIAILAEKQECAKTYSDEVKRVYSMYFQNKYQCRKILQRTEVCIQYLDSDRYLRNALAYIPRNAIDAGSRVEDYRWSGYRGMFADGRCPEAVRRVADMSRREREAVFHTHEDLSSVTWLINERGELEPASCCDTRYLEDAFDNDHAFFLKIIGTQNMADMDYKLVSGPRSLLPDRELLEKAEDLSKSWFAKTIAEINHEKKIKLITFLYRTSHTTVAQLSRIFGLERATVERIVKR